MLMKDVKQNMSKDAIALLAKKEKTVKEHIETCDYDSKLFKLLYITYTDDSISIRNAFTAIDAYSTEFDDRTLLSNDEFAALINFSINNEYEGNDINEINKFIKCMKDLNISDDEELTHLFSEYYDSLVMSDKEKVSNLKQLFNRYKSEKNDALLNGKSPLKSKKTLLEIEKYLVISKSEAAEYKSSKIKEIEEYLSKEEFSGKEIYEIELIHQLRKYNYNTEYILSNVPDINLVREDFESLNGKSFLPYSVIFLREYLAGDKELSKYPENLGSYNIHSFGIRPVPFTKSQYVKSMKKDNIQANK